MPGQVRRGRLSRPHAPATFTRWRVLTLILIFPATFVATGLLVQAGGNAWTLPGAAAPDWAPAGDSAVIRCIGDCR